VLGKLIDLWPSLGAGVVGGFLSWFLTWLCSLLAGEWVEKPVAEFRRLRSSIVEELHFYANVHEEPPTDVREAAKERIRRLSSEVLRASPCASISAGDGSTSVSRQKDWWASRTVYQPSATGRWR
jgi:hypothetical protein